ncbi:Uncharacterised protein [Mycobacteroides abscessus subsp. abscessus]|nr:Uncharacterised protein [Mycobacteroides abscessus subsp. abscessus]SKU31403.1 Uncharacterised protein [Mycobacteroides abscessus subsp. abscessus]
MRWAPGAAGRVVSALIAEPPCLDAPAHTHPDAQATLDRTCCGQVAGCLYFPSGPTPLCLGDHIQLSCGSNYHRLQAIVMGSRDGQQGVNIPACRRCDHRLMIGM